MNTGIYETLINKIVRARLDELDSNEFFIQEQTIDKAEAIKLLSQYFSIVLQKALTLIEDKEGIGKQIKLCNRLVKALSDEIRSQDFSDNIIEIEGKILTAVLNRIDHNQRDLVGYVQEITPSSRLIHSELFTGGNSSISLDTELIKEIKSADRIDLLVSFIKLQGFNLLAAALAEFTNRGGKLRVLSTTYMGATDAKAIKGLSELKNTSIKISYNNSNERLHAKAYLFHRNSGFHTGYIGSSNFSRTALTKGLEWNLKITTNEVSHIIDKFEKTFESYWANSDFEEFDFERDYSKLSKALNNGRNGSTPGFVTFFDLEPKNFQKEILEKLQTERVAHGRYKNLIVAATGTGKTIISAFDFKDFRKGDSGINFLFVAHRKEILQQAQSTYQAVLKDENFGELWVDGNKPNSYQIVFASVQSLNNHIESIKLTPDYYDYIVIDEVHHLTANSYRSILKKFTPQVLLGLTATPERMDGGDILADFDGHIAADIRLPEALNNKLLCPFHYYGITDNTDISHITWTKGRYDSSELTKIYTSNDSRVRSIINNIEKYIADPELSCTLGFCASQVHAKYMAEKFLLANYKAAYLVGSETEERAEIRRKLRSREINFLFVVDIFNEGVDIPEIDTVLFLRPTESLTIFLQQLGRGLRLCEGKDSLTVLDFVGNARPEYDFEKKFRALIGKTNRPTIVEIQEDFPRLPLGCSIILEKKAKESILQNISKATRSNKADLINKMRTFGQHTEMDFNLLNFIDLYNIPLQVIYKNGGWKRLCALAGKIPEFQSAMEEKIVIATLLKWLSTRSLSYFKFILKLARLNFKVQIDELSAEEQTMCLMLHFDIQQTDTVFRTLQESINAIGENPIMISEIEEVTSILIDKIDYLEKEINLHFNQPLKLHSRYTRDQILAAFGISTFERRSSNREGVAFNVQVNTELLFIDLFKSEKHYSPTTMYHDYSINDILFHWQSQNSASPETQKGKSYLMQKENGKTILLFVREQSKDEFGNTMGYVFLGDASFVSNIGAKPMNITWRLREPIPPYLWNASAKMVVG
jgi:superfamily II DNA or RNA helicase